MPLGANNTDKSAMIDIISIMLGPVENPYTALLINVPKNADTAPVKAAINSTFS